MTVVLSLALISCLGAFYFALAKEGGNPNSPWESILDVFVTGGEVGIVGPVELDPATHVDVSGTVSLVPGQHVDVSGSTVDVSGSSVILSDAVTLAPGTQVGITGDVSLEPGTQVGVSGEVSLASGTEVEVYGEVSLAPFTTVGVSGSVSLASDTEVVIKHKTYYQNLWTDLVLSPGEYENSLFYYLDGYRYVYVMKSSDDYVITVKWGCPLPGDRMVTETTSIYQASAHGIYTIGLKAPYIWVRIENTGTATGGPCSVAFYAVS